MQAKNVLTRPRLRPLENTSEERHASWLELFFDLIFVLAVAQVAHNLEEDLTPGGFLRYVALFIPVWWAWVGYTFYADRFESDETIYRLLMLTGMLGVAALSVNIHYALGESGRAFALSYVFLRVVLIALYTRAALLVPVARDLSVRYIIGFSGGAVLWLTSAFVSAPTRYWLWAAGLVFEIGTPLLNIQIARRTPYDASHVPERYGLFTIIVLGEAVIAVANGVAGAEWRGTSAFAAVAGFGVAAALWWLYFEFFNSCAVQQSWQATNAGGPFYVYGHFPIVVSVAATGMGAKQAIIDAGSNTFSAGARWTLCGGVALYLFSILGIRLLVRRADFVPVRALTIIVVMLLAAFGGRLPPLVLLGSLFAVLVGEVMIEVWRNRRAEECAPDMEPTARCSHLETIREVTPGADGCEECLKTGDRWVELRLCRACGHVGCCDNSKGKHATKHFHSTSHPVIASFEPGENWSWCYVDETYL